MPKPNVEWIKSVGIDEEAYNAYDLIGTESKDGLESRIYIDRNFLSLLPDTVQLIHTDNLNAIALSRQIDTRCSSWFYIVIKKELGNFAEDNGRVSPEFISARSEARIAAIVHEQIHELQEVGKFRWGRNFEALPQLSEFLFTRGEYRLEHFFYLFEDSFDPECSDAHALAWTKMREVLEDPTQADSSDDYETRYRKILKREKEMTEAEKIALIQKVIKQSEELWAKSRETEVLVS